MKKKFIKYICALSLCIPSLGYGGGTSGIETRGTGGSAVKDSADKTSKENSSGEAQSYAMMGIQIAGGAAMVGAGTAPCGTPAGCNAGLITQGVVMIGMGIMSGMQGKEHGKSKDQAKGTGFNTDGLGNPYGGSNSDPLDEKNPNSLINMDPNIKAVKTNLAKMEKLGIYDPKAGTLKIGDKKYKVTDFASPDSMAAAGFSKGAIDGAMAMAAQVEKRAADKLEKLKIGALTNASGFDEGGGGKGLAGGSDDTAGGGNSYGLGSSEGSLLAGKAGLGRDPSSLAGMQKNYNGDPIGVAADDIFNMMNRRYKTKESQDSFFSDAEVALQK